MAKNATHTKTSTHNAPGTQTATTSKSDELRWKLEGIAVDKRNTQARLEYLTNLEAQLRGQALTGAPQKQAPAGRRANGTGAVRRRKPMSDAQREAMRAAAKKRWARVKGEAAIASTVPTEAVPAAVPAAVESV